jgi:hypothetical protein
MSGLICFTSRHLKVCCKPPRVEADEKGDHQEEKKGEGRRRTKHKAVQYNTSTRELEEKGGNNKKTRKAPLFLVSPWWSPYIFLGVPSAGQGGLACTKTQLYMPPLLHVTQQTLSLIVLTTHQHNARVVGGKGGHLLTKILLYPLLSLLSLSLSRSLSLSLSPLPSSPHTAHPCSM